MYNAAVFADAVMPSVIENVQVETRRKILQGRSIHMDSACACSSGRARKCIQASRVKSLPHPTYSSDLAPSHFFLFGLIKGKISDYNFESWEDLLNGIAEIFTGGDENVLLSGVESWINRLKWVIKPEGKGSLCKEKHETHSSKLAEQTGICELTDRPLNIIPAFSARTVFAPGHQYTATIPRPRLTF
jgi:hypothetical protein